MRHAYYLTIRRLKQENDLKFKKSLNYAMINLIAGVAKQDSHEKTHLAKIILGCASNK